MIKVARNIIILYLLFIKVYAEVILMLRNHPCARCGRDGAALGFGTTWLCEDCYGTVGSCCMEFDGDDMGLEDRSWWESRMEPKG